jgi:hypothetical protein
LIETALSLAAIFMGQPGRYDSLRATFDSRLDTGPLEAAERSEILAEVAAGALSLETALSLLGHDDVDAELARIAAEKAKGQAKALEIARATAPKDPTAPPSSPTQNPPAPGQPAQLQGQQPPQGGQQ